jgi:hypothetical protein
MFAAPGEPRRDEITVVKDFVVSHPALEKGVAEFYVEYVQLGRIDTSKARFSTLPAPYLKVRAGFYVSLQSRPMPGRALSQAGQPAEWRIEGPVPEPHLTVDTAIRYAIGLREDARDSTTRKSAEATIAALKRFR